MRVRQTLSRCSFMRYLGWFLSAGALITVAACDADPVVPVREIVPRTSVHLIVGVDSDLTMGRYSAVARHLAWALRDSATRMNLATLLKHDSTTLLGADLQACDTEGPVKAIFDAAERRGAGLASVVCATLKRTPGGVLYMDRDRLRAWDGTTIPIVTAIEHPEHPPLRSFHGYLATDRAIDLPPDGSLAGPILVILPLIHPSHHEFARNKGRDRIVTVPAPSGAQAKFDVSPRLLK